MNKLSEEIRKHIEVVEYNSNTDKERKIPEIPSWAFNLSNAFASTMSSQSVVEKSVKEMIDYEYI